jgi:TatD DNase family protein
MFELIKQTGLKKLVFHCYSEDTSFAKKILDYSDEAYFWFSGILTYKNAINIQDAAYSIPLGRILIETDSPFLSPQPVRWQVNEPSNVRFVFEKLCELRPEWKEEVEKQVYANSLRFYNMK